MGNVARKIRVMALLLTAVLPRRAKIAVYRTVFRYEVDGSARIGLCFLDAKDVLIGPGCRIGHFTVVRRLPQLVLADHATIGQWNWITCGEFFTGGRSEVPPPPQQGLFIERHAALTSRHYVDCAGGVFIGQFTTVAGVRSTLLTHQIDLEARQVCKPIRIGDYCYIGSDVKFVPGACVPDRCIIGMGAVVVGTLPECGGLYAGVPARYLRPVEAGEYFTRAVGRAR
jgi:acetyltransferase-like isoleucine patch superfamily enzyme